MSLPLSPSSDDRPDGARPLAKLLPFAMRYKGHMVCALIALILAAAATLAVPLAARRMIDYGFFADNADFIDRYFAMMILAGLLLALASAARYYFVTWIGERMSADMRIAVYSHLLTLSMPFFETTRTGEVLSRLTADTTVIQSVLGATASGALRNLVLLAGAVAMMVVTSPTLSGLVLLAIPALVLPLVHFGRWVRALSRSAQDTLADSAAYAAETLSAMQTVQSFTHEAQDRIRFAKATETAFDAARMRVWARSVLTACIIFLATASIVVVLWFGSKSVLDGTLTLGALAQFVLYAIFAAGAISALSQVWGEVQLALGAAERIVELLETRPAIVAPADPVPLPSPARGEIRFENVRFTYPGRPDAPALEDISFTVEPGETLALVGPSGAGKSTVFALLGRFYDAQSGEITIDGVPVARADPLDLRSRLSVVPQETVIFSASIAENIRYGRPEASAQEVRAAAVAACADRFIDAMPQGMDTLVGERGVMLSGGQRQRIAIARAILRDAPILLLDEATSALDAESEMLIQQGLERLMEGRTTLVIAHRLATIRKAKRIIVLDGGRVVEEGTHNSLRRRQGLYRRLSDLQFTGEGADVDSSVNGQSNLLAAPLRA